MWVDDTTLSPRQTSIPSAPVLSAGAPPAGQLNAVLLAIKPIGTGWLPDWGLGSVQKNVNSHPSAPRTLAWWQTPF